MKEITYEQEEKRRKYLKIISIICVIIVIFLIAGSFFYIMIYSPGGEYPPPQGGWKKAENHNNIEYLYFGSFKYNSNGWPPEWAEMKIIINNITSGTNSSFNPINQLNIINYKQVSGFSNYNITGVDINKDGIINNDEYIKITNLGSVGSNYHYKAILLYIPEGSILSDIQFTI